MTQEKKAIADAFSRAAEAYDSASHVQQNVGRRLLDVLHQQNRNYEKTLDVGCGTGALTQMLKPFTAHLTALDLAPGMLAVAREHDRQQNGEGVIDQFVCGDAEQLGFANASLDLVFSSFALQWCDDLPSVFQGVRHTLKTGGQFIFSLPVDSTLKELKQSWSQVDAEHNHVNTFPEIEKVRAELQTAGFHLSHFHEHTDVAHYGQVRELLRELKTLGAHRVTSNRTPRFTGRQRINAMMQAYEAFRQPDGLLPASWHYLIICADV